jgi:ABC-type multidrug transport system fused ATPase/permease subunit
MRYSENRHRLGLVGPDLEKRLLRVRHAFEHEIPKSLEPSIEFFRPDRLCSATNVLDNLLFGRIAEDQADARSQVLAAARRVLEQLGLLPDVMRVGLQTRIDPLQSGLSPARRAAIDLARCLVRRPDNLIVADALDELPAKRAVALARRLRLALQGRGLVLVVPAQLADVADLFDEVVTFKAGRALAGANRPAAGYAVPHAPARDGVAAGRVLTPEPTWSPT